MKAVCGAYQELSPLLRFPAPRHERSPDVDDLSDENKPIVLFTYSSTEHRLLRSQEEFATSLRSLQYLYRFLYPSVSSPQRFGKEDVATLDQDTRRDQRINVLEKENAELTQMLTQESALETKMALSGIASTAFFAALIWESTVHVRIIHPMLAGICLVASIAVFLLSAWRLRRDKQGCE